MSEIPLVRLESIAINPESREITGHFKMVYPLYDIKISCELKQSSENISVTELTSLGEIRKAMYSSLHQALSKFTSDCQKEMVT